MKNAQVWVGVGTVEKFTPENVDIAVVILSPCGTEPDISTSEGCAIYPQFRQLQHRPTYVKNTTAIQGFTSLCLMISSP